MKTKNISLAVFSLMFLFAISLVSAAEVVTLVSPSTSGTLSGATALLNASIANPEGNFTCTFYAMSSLTANSSWEQIGQIENETAEVANITFDSNVLQDANNYQFNVSCGNSTEEYADVLTTSVTIDNTVPQTPSLSPSDLTEITSSTTQTFTGTVTGENTTSCTSTIARGGASSGNDYSTPTVTHSSNSCTFTKAFTSTSDNGVWYWTITASDETNTSTSTTNKIVVSLSPANGGLPPQADDGLTETIKNNFWMIFGIILFLAIVVIVVIKNS